MFKFLSLYTCFGLIHELSGYDIPRKKVQPRAEVCSYIHEKSLEHKLDPNLSLAIGWLESTYTYKTGRPVTTRSGRVLHAEGPLQVLKYYHCRKNPDCDTVEVGVKLLKRLTDKYGLKKGLAIYAGGYENPKSLRYARFAISISRKVKKIRAGF